MDMEPRNKPRVNHVRTGCQTCKRRRVKCSEERPHCSRCIRGGFICAGYAVPQAWIFTGSVEAQASVPEAQELGPEDQRQSLMPLNSPIQLGNSDPFDSQSIPIGPRESEILKVYRDFAIQQLGKLSWWKVDRVDVVQQTCLSDKAATFALLARNSAAQGIRSERVHSTDLTVNHLNYLTGAQAELRKNLALMTGPKIPPMITQVLWTTCLLAYAELINGSPTTGVHLRAMSQMVVKYTELMGDQVNKADIIGVAIIDLVAACITLTRPRIDMIDWFPSIFHMMWEQTGVCRSVHLDTEGVIEVVHRDVKDKRLRNIILDQREEQEKHHALLEGEFDSNEASVRGQSVHSRQLFQHAKLLHIVLDAMERLGTARISEEQMQDQLARAYVSLSVMLWLLITSPITFTAERLLDGTGKILQHMRGTLGKEMEGTSTTSPASGRRYREARLWALCIGLHTELYRKEHLGFDPACGKWYAEAFGAEIKLMHIRAPQQVAAISEQFLGLDLIKPHISQWWLQVIDEHRVEEDEQ